jgi:hypothetical protein
MVVVKIILKHIILYLLPTIEESTTTLFLDLRTKQLAQPELLELS